MTQVGTGTSAEIQATPPLQVIAETCDVLSHLFAAPPNMEMLEALHAVNAQPAMADSGVREIVEGLSQLAEYGRGQDAERALLAVIADHSQLFVGPLQLKAPPWSSVYLDAGMLNGPSAQRVAEIYQRAGVQVQRPGQEPEDHIAYELSFVAELCRRILAARQAADDSLADTTLKTLNGFCQDHLCRWIDPFIRRVQEHAETDFYRGLARLTRGFVWLVSQSVVQRPEESSA